MRCPSSELAGQPGSQRGGGNALGVCSGQLLVQAAQVRVGGVRIWRPLAMGACLAVSHPGTRRRGGLWYVLRR